MKGQGDHYTCSCVVDEPVNYNHTVNEVVGNEAVVNMYDLAVKEVVGISAVVNSSGVVDTIAVSVVMDAIMVHGLMRRWMMPLWSVGWWLMRR